MGEPVKDCDVCGQPATHLHECRATRAATRLRTPIEALEDRITALEAEVFRSTAPLALAKR
jgi:hypothetical protein